MIWSRLCRRERFQVRLLYKTYCVKNFGCVLEFCLSVSILAAMKNNPILKSCYVIPSQTAYNGRLGFKEHSI